jgi:pimeloyl-ACP methyl ester carboxylesterase
MTTTAIATKEVTLSNGKARYLESGSGHPVILLHGVAIAGGADDWRPALDQLGTSYHFIAPYLISFPPSDTRADLDAFPYLTDFVREFQDAMGIKSSHIIGATMGGWIAGLFAYESPNRVDKLIMTGNPGFHGAANNRLSNFQAPDAEAVRQAIDKVAYMLPESERESIAQEKIARLQEPGYADAHGSMMRTMANPENRSRFNLLRRLPYIDAPTFFLLGRGDPTSESADKLVALVPGSQSYVIETGGHQIHYENAEEFSQQVRDFLG